MSFQSAFIASLPRSGSTVLTTMLDRREGVVCLPESFFPWALQSLGERKMQDRDFVAALFLASCPDGSPLTFGEARACVRATKAETMDALAATFAEKLGRGGPSLKVAVWKATRLTGRWRAAGDAGGKFVILHRNPLNVYESQFRVDFGMKNRNPFRFCLFEASYAAAFATYPAAMTYELDYSNIPERLDELAAWLGAGATVRSANGSSFTDLSGQMPWHTEIGKPFTDRDAEKRENLSPATVSAIRSWRNFFRLLTPLNRMARIFADRRQMKSLEASARKIISEHLS